MPVLRVGILGATGAVGQKFIRLLDGHPWFRVARLGASDRSAGRPYAEATAWRESSGLPVGIAEMEVAPCEPGFFGDVDLVFSGLDSKAAVQIEPAFAAAGIPVVSNAKTFRMHPDVPLVVPEVNPDHMDWVTRQEWWPGGGFIVTNPNCVAIPLVMALKPVHDRFGIREITLTSMQAISGAGYPGVSAMDILGNVIPHIADEEEKVKEEPLKILGIRDPGDLPIHPTCTRVPVADGHTLAIRMQLAADAGAADVEAALREFRSPVAGLGLPGAMERPLVVHEDPFSPRPARHAEDGAGMLTHVGRIRDDGYWVSRSGGAVPVHRAVADPDAAGNAPGEAAGPEQGGSATVRRAGSGISLVVMAHNTIRGAAGAAILNAELLVAKGYVKGRG